MRNFLGCKEVQTLFLSKINVKLYYKYFANKIFDFSLATLPIVTIGYSDKLSLTITYNLFFFHFHIFFFHIFNTVLTNTLYYQTIFSLFLFLFIFKSWRAQLGSVLWYYCNYSSIIIFFYNSYYTNIYLNLVYNFSWHQKN